MAISSELLSEIRMVLNVDGAAEMSTDDSLRDREGCTIFRVPSELLGTEKDSKDYRPMLVPIGPYHAYSSSVQDMEGYKKRCVEAFVSCHDHPKEVVHKCLAVLSSMESQIRSSYSDWIPKNSKDLALSMLLDGCFVLSILLRQFNSGRRCPPQLQRVFKSLSVGRPWVVSTMTLDLLLLENQIPFFVLQALFDILRVPSLDQGINLVSLALEVVRDINPSPHNSPVTTEIHHLLHLFYLSMLPSPRSADEFLQVDEEKMLKWIPGARELEAAGVKFRKKKNANSFMDIQFNNGIMEIPVVELWDYSRMMFKNLIAFEQCYPGTELDLTVYTSFLDLLMNNDEDKRLLELRGIVIDRTYAKVYSEGVRFFSEVGEHACYPIDINFLAKVFQDVEVYRNSRIHRWRATLMRDHCSSPWSIIAVVAVTLGLLFSGFQAFS